MKNRLVFGLVIFNAIACSQKDGLESGPVVSAKTSQEKREFDLLCDQYDKLVKSSDYADMDSENRAEELEVLLANELSPSSSAYVAWSAIQFCPPNQRYLLFKEAAKSVGYSGWNCSVIEEHGFEIGTKF